MLRLNLVCRFSYFQIVFKLFVNSNSCVLYVLWCRQLLVILNEKMKNKTNWTRSVLLMYICLLEGKTKSNWTEKKREGLISTMKIWVFFHCLDRLAGTLGAVLTCPLEVIKTRYQSSQSVFFQENSKPLINNLSRQISRPTIIGSLG